MKTNYVSDAWYVAAWIHELEGHEIITRTIMSQPIVIYRSADSDALIALEDRCCHRAYPLSRGTREGDDLRCGYHGFRYDSAGKCVEIPGKSKIPDSVRVKRYPIAVRQSWIWTWMGRPEAADESLIPTSWALDDDQWIGRSGFVDYDAYYELVNDNLTDLSHLAFVHTNSFGAGAEWAKDADRLTEHERGLLIEKWIVPERASNMEGGLMAEIWQSYDYLVPGVLLMRNYFFPMGTAKEVGAAPPLEQALFRTVSWQAVTPVTDRKTRYFFAVAAQNGPGGEQAVEVAFQLSSMAFEEDRVTIEAQQRNLDLSGDHMMLAGHDEAPIRFRRLLTRLIRSNGDDAKHPRAAARFPVI